MANIKKTAKKKPVKKKAAKKAAPKKAVVLKQAKPIGVVTHYYGNIEVGILKFNKPVKVGIEIEIKGATTDFSQTITSMQFDHKEIPAAKKGQEVGVKMKDKVREGDEIFEVKTP